jgi:hypothetical protein
MHDVESIQAKGVTWYGIEVLSEIVVLHIVAQFSSVKVAHDACSKKPHDRFSARLVLKEDQDKVVQVRYICFVMLLYWWALLFEISLSLSSLLFWLDLRTQLVKLVIR